MLFDKLSDYASQDNCPMHMPGHKRNTRMLGCKLPYSIDITEIDGFDNLHDASGILKETADIASALYGSKKSFLLVNGSTGGILAAVKASARRGSKIIMARNCHQSVYHAAELNCLQTVYMLPEPDSDTGIHGSITPRQVADALNSSPDAKLIVLTSPTYEGVISDIKSISAIAHDKGVPVLVDEAHGAHLGFSGAFPGEALKNGADIVITGLHKTLPALTQCALAHIGGDLVDEEWVARELAVFETSSPSYVLMASIDSCVRMLSQNKSKLFSRYEKNISRFDVMVKKLKQLKVLCHGDDLLINHHSFFGFDPGKLVISTKNTVLTGQDLAHLLRSRYRIEPEMACTDYVLAMTSVCNTAKQFEQLAEALTEIDGETEICTGRQTGPYENTLPKQKYPVCDALDFNGQFLPVNEAVGMISLEYIWAYPPGIPLIVPGEIITPCLTRQIKRYSSAQITLHSTWNRLPNLLYVKRI